MYSMASKFNPGFNKKNPAGEMQYIDETKYIQFVQNSHPPQNHVWSVCRKLRSWMMPRCHVNHRNVFMAMKIMPKV
jgi:hypothetical protein